MLDEFLQWAWAMVLVAGINTVVLVAILFAIAKYGNKNTK